MNRKVILSALGAVLILGVYLTTFVVSQREYAIVTQFGKPVHIITQPGLYVKLPGFLQRVNRFDRRLDVFNTQIIQLLLGDKNPIIVTCYMAWKIDDPLVFFQSLSTVDNARQKLSDMLISQLGNILGDYTMDNIINVDTGKVKLADIEDTILANTNERVRENYGLEVHHVGIHRLSYPAIVSEAVYERMRSEREKEANKLRAEGRQEADKIKAETDREVKEILAEAYREAEIIKGEGDQQSTRIYAGAYGKNPEFFQFMKSLEVYREVLKDKSTLILSTDSELFKYLNPETLQ
jgi:membrane protease subunit HflC